MAWVVFLRGVNVGGHKAFSPAALARDLAALDVANVGAAGTFVVRKAIGQAVLRAEILARLPVAAEVMICRARDVLGLAARPPFPDRPAGPDLTRYVSVLARRPRALPPLPVRHPDGADWQVQVLDVLGRFALSLHRRTGKALVYPNEVVERRLGVPATTRNWNTIATVCEALNGT